MIDACRINIPNNSDGEAYLASVGVSLAEISINIPGSDSQTHFGLNCIVPVRYDARLEKLDLDLRHTVIEVADIAALTHGQRVTVEVYSVLGAPTVVTGVVRRVENNGQRAAVEIVKNLRQAQRGRVIVSGDMARFVA